MGAHLGFAGGWGSGQKNGARERSRMVAAAASEVDGSSTSIFLVTGGRRSSNSGDASVNWRREGVCEVRREEERRVV